MAEIWGGLICSGWWMCLSLFYTLLSSHLLLQSERDLDQENTRFYHLPVPKDSLLFLNDGLLLWEAIKATGVPVHVLTERQCSRVAKSLTRESLALPLPSCCGVKQGTEPC